MLRPLLTSGLAALLLAIPILITSFDREDDDSPKPLVFGMELNYPPFEIKDAEGNPDGVGVDLAKAIGAELGREIEVKDISFEGLIPALQSGRVDCVISSMTITPERAKAVDFSDPYVRTGICLLVQKGSEVRSAEDLNTPDRRLMVKLGTTGDVYAKEFIPEAEIVVLRDASNCALEVAQGKADAFLYDQVSIYQFWQAHSERTDALLNPLREEVWGIAVQKGNTELLEQINAFLAKYRESGGFEALGDKWFDKWKDDFDKLGVSFVF